MLMRMVKGICKKEEKVRRVRRNLADGIECEMHSNCASGYCHTPQCFMQKEGKVANCKKLCMAKSWWTKSTDAVTN